MSQETPDELFTSCWRKFETKIATLNGDVTETVRPDRNRLQHLVEHLARNPVEHAARM